MGLGPMLGLQNWAYEDSYHNEYEGCGDFQVCDSQVAVLLPKTWMKLGIPRTTITIVFVGSLTKSLIWTIEGACSKCGLGI